MLRTDVANVYGASPPSTLWSELVEDAVARALRLDAACVVVNLLSLRGEPARQCVPTSRSSGRCEPVGLPVMVEPLAMKPGDAGYGVNGDADTVVTLVRQAAELADATRPTPPTTWASTVESYARAACPCSCGAAGARRTRRSCAAPRPSSSRARPIVYGRNVVQHADPAGMTRALMAIVHEGASAEEALAALTARA